MANTLEREESTALRSLYQARRDIDNIWARLFDGTAAREKELRKLIFTPAFLATLREVCGVGDAGSERWIIDTELPHLVAREGIYFTALSPGGIFSGFESEVRVGPVLVFTFELYGEGEGARAALDRLRKACPSSACVFQAEK